MINVWFDGACVPTNPGGIASFGIIIKKDGKLLYSKTGFVGTPPNTTNNLAEHAGLLNALIWLKENDLHTDKIHVYGDSSLVIKQIFGKWKIKRGVYKKIALQTKSLVSNFPNITGSWIPREENKEADNISRGGLWIVQTVTASAKFTA